MAFADNASLAFIYRILNRKPKVSTLKSPFDLYQYNIVIFQQKSNVIQLKFNAVRV